MAAYNKHVCYNLRNLIYQFRHFSTSRYSCRYLVANNQFSKSVDGYGCNFGSQHKLTSQTNRRENLWRLYSTASSAESATEKDDGDHSIIKNSETVTSGSEKLDFQAETKMLLDIVAKSLYSEKEVFIRELISNGNDALERLRYATVTDPTLSGLNRALEIHIATDKLSNQFIIQDTGVGMTKEELISNLGTIARSGSKAFLKEAHEKNMPLTSIIGQFGVGFYSAFMVADKVEVFTASLNGPNNGFKWTSDGLGSYEIQEATGVEKGTKIILHLKNDCLEFANEDTIKGEFSKLVNSQINDAPISEALSLDV